MKTIAFVYRDNDLFAKYMPIVFEFLRGLGHMVVTKVYPCGFEPREMKLSDVPKADQYAIDSTFYRAVCEEKRNERKWMGDLVFFGRAFSDATDQAFRERGYAGDDYALSKEETKNLFKMIVHNALANGAPRPDGIHIIENNMGDHAPFWPSEYRSGELSEWFSEILPDTPTHVHEDVQWPRKLPRLENIWLVGDRHFLKSEYVTMPNNLVLRFPLETMTSDLGDMGFFERDEEAFKTHLCQAIVKYLEEG